MEFLSCCINGLESPWSDKIRGLLVPSSDVDPLLWESNQEISAYGLVTNHDIFLRCQLAFLEPFVGVRLLQPSFMATIEIDEPSVFPTGSWIGFDGIRVSFVDKSQRHVQLNSLEKTTIWNVAERQTGFPINVTHLFAGAFSGWERAAKWLNDANALKIQQSIAVDHCCDVMQSWQIRNNSDIMNGNIPIDHGIHQKNIGILSAVGEGTWTNLCRFQSNHLMTASPPCQPWSRGGKQQGLECLKGVPFAETVWRARMLRPLVLCCECADTTPNHPHFTLIIHAMRIAGYRNIWSEVIQLEKISSMSRSRWLAVWLRSDLTSEINCGNFKLVDVFRKGWNTPEFDFFLPDQIKHQLVLKTDLLNIYGNRDFLPPNKRWLFQTFPSSQIEVLNHRILGEFAIMPTLVASYTQQHHIDATHLSEKGIFAILTMIDGKFAFFDPFRFVCYLGAPCNECVPLPLKIDFAFKHLGNAISVPQALLCMIVGCKSLGLCDGLISSNINQCWNDRILSSKACILVNADFAFVVPFPLVQEVFERHCIPKITNPKIFFVSHGYHTAISNEDDISVEQVLQKCGFDKRNLQQWNLISNDVVIPWTTNLLDCIDVPFGIFSQDEAILEGLFSKSCDADSNCDSLDFAIIEVIDAIEIKLRDEIGTVISTLPPCEADNADDWNVTEALDVNVNIDIETENDQLNESRFQQFCRQGSPLASDELAFIRKQIIKIGNYDHYNDFYRFEEFCDSIPSILKQFSCGTEKFAAIAVLIENHWFACELDNPNLPTITFVGIPDKVCQVVSHAASCAFVAAGKKASINFVKLFAPNGLCGWALVYRWFWKQGPSCDINAIHRETKQTAALTFEPCPENTHDANIWNLAVRIRDLFLHSDPVRNDHIVIGSAEDEDTTMQSTEEKPVDPWLKNDPWGAKKQCKWEDLKLPTDHHFKLKNGEAIKQVTRQQISVNISGIAFSTRANVVSTFQTGPPAATCLLVPASEETSFDCEPPLMTKGPYEIIVQDEALGSVYKRQVLLVQQNDEVSHQLPTPKYNSTAPALSEIVIEVHEALITKELATSITEKPLEVMKKIVIEQFPSNTVKNLHVYAFRIIQTSNGNSQNRIFQVMCKIPTTARAGCLERSGAGDAFFRDFVGKGESVEDLSTLPKFWSHDRNSKDNALRSASSIVGFAGLTLTRRGIAVRAWNSKIGHLRKVLFADDERISTINIDVIPKFTRESTGWPSSIGASEVVKATSHELGIPPIPTRCYKALGVTTWTLTFQEPPKKTRFLINFNGSTHEILITEPSQISKDQSSNKKGKGKAKGKGKGNGDKTTSQPSRPSHIDDDSTNQRLSVLEAKFCTMERRQNGMEAKINEGFSGVNNQLRQILHAIQPRSSTGSTGASPPQKVPKTGNN